MGKGESGKGESGEGESGKGESGEGESGKGEIGKGESGRHRLQTLAPAYNCTARGTQLSGYSKALR